MNLGVQINSFEFGVVSVLNPITNAKYLVCGLYKPPQYSVLDYINDFDLLCDFLSTNDKGKHNIVIFGGDFNINLMHTGVNNNVAHFINKVYSHGLLLPFSYQLVLHHILLPY